jgi:hypothetical protein
MTYKIASANLTILGGSVKFGDFNEAYGKVKFKIKAYSFNETIREKYKRLANLNRKINKKKGNRQKCN